MTAKPLFRAILIAGLLLTVTRFAAADDDIVRCTDGDGAVSYADLPCKFVLSHPIGTMLAQAPAPKARPSAQKLRYAKAEEARAVKSAAKNPSGRRSVIDSATMDMAKASAESNDHAASMVRDQLLAERMDRDAKSWTFWRL